VSEPFEVRIGRFDEQDALEAVDSSSGGGDLYEKAVEAALLPVVRNCLDRDENTAPATVDEPFGSLVERDGKYARRVVYAIRHMFGIEFAAAVVPADGNVRKLAWRICNAKQVLVSLATSDRHWGVVLTSTQAPYSMSRSRGATTPVTEKFPEL
jgi:phosphatidylethanolamine N-methyltransferase